MNYNEDIFLEVIKLGNFLDNMYVQSFGNSTCIYKINIINGDWFYKPIYHIKGRTPLDGILNRELIEIDYDDFHRIDNIKWCSTLYTINLN